MAATKTRLKAELAKALRAKDEFMKEISSEPLYQSTSKEVKQKFMYVLTTLGERPSTRSNMRLMACSWM